MIYDILDNVTHKYSYKKGEYILLLKHQKQKDYSMLYVTDCQGNFWFKPIDEDVVNQLKEQMRLTTPIITFCESIRNGIVDSSSISFKQEGQNTILQLSIGLQVGAGLKLTCKIQIDQKIGMQQQEQFKMLLKIFLKQLYEAKNNAFNQKARKAQSVVQIQSIKVWSDTVNQGSLVQEKDKNRHMTMTKNIMNPNRRKRKAPGIKFNGHE